MQESNLVLGFGKEDCGLRPILISLIIIDALAFSRFSLCPFSIIMLNKDTSVEVLTAI